MRFDPDLALSLIPDMLQGFLVTLALVPPCAVLGLLLAVPVAVGKTSERRIFRLPALAFSVFFRGAPALIVIYMVYYGIPKVDLVRSTVLWDFFRYPINCAILALSLNHAGFVSEILRGGLAAVPRGVTEAATAMSMPRWVLYWKIKLPLAFRYAMSPYRNEFIFLLKTTSLVGTITVFDLLAVATEAVELTYDPMTPLVLAAAFYWALVNLVRLAFDRLENHLRRHLR